MHVLHRGHLMATRPAALYIRECSQKQDCHLNMGMAACYIHAPSCQTTNCSTIPQNILAACYFYVPFLSLGTREYTCSTAVCSSATVVHGRCRMYGSTNIQENASEIPSCTKEPLEGRSAAFPKSKQQKKKHPNGHAGKP